MESSSPLELQHGADMNNPPAIAKKKKTHPLKMPLRTSPISGRTICRYHNYDVCKKYEDPTTSCDLDHDTCHVCLQPDHRALDCPQYLDDQALSEFQAKVTLKNTRPEGYQMKTVLGQPVVWTNELGIPPGFEGLFRMGDDDQLRRCRKLKRAEANMIDDLLKLQQPCSVWDVGAHLGDSVMTWALYARAQQPNHQLVFVALEPNPAKCQWIRRVAEANQLSDRIDVHCVAVGDTRQTVEPDPKRKARSVVDGSLMYQPVHDMITEYGSSDSSASSDDIDDEDQHPAPVPMIPLDDLYDVLPPMGLLHVDVEGWESKVIRGAKKFLSTKTTTPCFVVAEAWDDKECRRRGVSESADQVITDAFEVETLSSLFKRQPDIVDIERNVVFRKRHSVVNLKSRIDIQSSSPAACG